MVAGQSTVHVHTTFLAYVHREKHGCHTKQRCTLDTVCIEGLVLPEKCHSSDSGGSIQALQSTFAVKQFFAQSTDYGQLSPSEWP